MGLAPKVYIPGDFKNGDLPKPSLKAYAFTEWTFDTPKRPTGTNLWVECNPPNKFEIWYSPLNWRDFLGTRKHDWEYMGIGKHRFWEYSPEQLTDAAECKAAGPSRGTKRKVWHREEAKRPSSPTT